MRYDADWLRWKFPDLRSVPYEDLLALFGRVIIKVDDDGYQGDSRVLLHDSAQGYGILVFGWGSCSGCDALQDCSTHEDLAKLADSLSDDIHWEPTREALLAWVNETPWDLKYSWHAEETHRFLATARAYLAEVPARG